MPSTTKDIGELLSTAHKHDKQVARDIFKIIISSVQYLARHGLALRGHNDSESNLIQLLDLRGEDNQELSKWLDRSWRKYTSHENQNEILELMPYSVLRKLLSYIHSSPFLSLMVDKTTDLAKKEQMTVII